MHHPGIARKRLVEGIQKPFCMYYGFETNLNGMYVRVEPTLPKGSNCSSTVTKGEDAKMSWKMSNTGAQQLQPDGEKPRHTVCDKGDKERSLLSTNTVATSPRIHIYRSFLHIRPLYSKVFCCESIIEASFT